MRRIAISFAVLITLAVGFALGQFEPVPPTNDPYAIFVDEALLEGELLAEGDEIGVFDGDLCVGVSAFTGNWPLTIITWEQDLDEFLPGFAPGNDIVFAYWQMESERTVAIDPADVVYSHGDGTFGFAPYTQIETMSGAFPPSHDIEVLTDLIDFGDVELNTVANADLVISNIGGSPLLINSATVTGDAVFGADVYQNVTIQPGDSDTLEITFAPTQETEYNAQVIIESNDEDEGTIVVDLMGSGTVDRHFRPVDPTNITYPLTIELATIDGAEIEVDDAIGVFDANLCVGVYLMTGDENWPVEVTAYGQDGQDPGYADGNPIRFQIFDASTNQSLYGRPNFTVGDGTFGDGGGATVTISAQDVIEYFNAITIDSRVFSNDLNRFFHDFGNVAALDNFATDGYDEDMDAPEPGAPANLFISTSFPHPEWDSQFGDNFMVDVRDADDDLTNDVKIYEFEVDTDQNGELVELFFQIGNEYPPEYGVVLFDVENGNYANLRDQDFDEYSYIAGNQERDFNLRLGDATPPVIDMTEPAVFPVEDDTLRSDTQYILTWGLNDLTSIRTVTVDYSIDNGGTWTQITVLDGFDNGPTNLGWTPPNVFTTEAKIRVHAEDWAGNSATQEMDFTFNIAPFVMNNNFAANWHLMSLPLVPDNNDVDDVLGDDIVGPYYLYGIDDEDGYVREFDIFHGPGYWLALAQQANIDVQGTPELDSSRYDLSDYWNIVGASLPTPTQRDDAFFTDGVEYNGFVDAVNAGWIAPVLYGYNNQTGTYFFSNQFVPWNGYWLQVLQEDITLVVYPPAPEGVVLADNSQENPRERRDELDDEFSWFVPIVATQAGRADLMAGFGVDEAATTDYDVWWDILSPPPPQGRWVRVTFEHLEYDAHARYLSQDIRTPLGVVDDGAQRTEQWVFNVIASSRGDITLTFADDSTGSIDSLFDYGYNVWMDYEINGVARALNLEDLPENRTFTFPCNRAEEPVEFTLYVSTFEEVSVGDENNAVLPSEFAISEVYPNPFNPETNIKLAIPNASKLSVRVYDLLGREVANLDPGMLSAGYHTLTWHPEVSSGLYFLKVSAENGWSDTRKLIYMQ